ncbi:MAG: hypothetical protein AAB455_02350 [Patescibacteria group bacterium]
MNKLTGKKVLIFQQRSWGKIIGRFLAEKLAGEGCHLAALTFKKSTHELIVNQPNVHYDLIVNHDEIMSRPKDYLAGDHYPLKQICEDLDIDSIWPIVSSLRNFVKSYGDKYYYGFRQNVSDEDTVIYIMALYKAIRKIFKDFDPDVILAANFVSLPHIMCQLYAKKRGKKMLTITDAKVQGVYIFSYDYRDSTGPFYDRVAELNAGAMSSSGARAKNYIKEFRSHFKQPDYVKSEGQKPSWSSRIRSRLAPYRQIINWYRLPATEYMETTGITLDHRPPRIILRDARAERRYRRYMETRKYYDLDQVGKFAYFPLQFQPEASIDVAAPYFSNQIETARLVAMSLPDDYTLVVKEHPAMVGKRPPSYIEKIDRTVNVKLIDYRTPNFEVIKRAELIVSPNSTTLAEAAFFNKPAIQLGDLGTTLKLPNVVQHRDLQTLAKKIKEILSISLHSADYERRLENFVAAAYDTNLKVNYIDLWEKGKLAERENLWQSYKQELERLA